MIDAFRLVQNKYVCEWNNCDAKVSISKLPEKEFLSIGTSYEPSEFGSPRLFDVYLILNRFNEKYVHLANVIRNCT